MACVPSLVELRLKLEQSIDVETEQFWRSQRQCDVAPSILIWSFKAVCVRACILHNTAYTERIACFCAYSQPTHPPAEAADNTCHKSGLCECICSWRERTAARRHVCASCTYCTVIWLTCVVS